MQRFDELADRQILDQASGWQLDDLEQAHALDAFPADPSSSTARPRMTRPEIEQPFEETFIAQPAPTPPAPMDWAQAESDYASAGDFWDAVEAQSHGDGPAPEPMAMPQQGETFVGGRAPDSIEGAAAEQGGEEASELTQIVELLEEIRDTLRSGGGQQAARPMPDSNVVWRKSWESPDEEDEEFSIGGPSRGRSPGGL